MFTSRPLMYGLAAAVLIVVLGMLAAPRLLSSSDESYNGTLVDAIGDPEEFQLASAGGEVRLSDFRGRLVVMYFGYTSCPDICPATLAKLARVRERLGDDADDVQVLMITVDPERDDPQRLADYVSNFDESFIGLSGTEEQLSAVASHFGILVQKRAGSAATGNLVDHTTTMVVLNQDGRERLYLGADLTVEQIENDLGNLL